MTFGIHSIGAYVPPARIDCEQHSERLGVSQDTLRARIGFEALAVKSEREETSDLAIQAVVDLQQRSGLRSDQIDCLVVVTQNPDAFGIPQVSALVHGKLGWPTCIAAFDVSLGCSGYVYALSIISSFLAAQGGSRGVLVTADPYSKIVDCDDRGTALIFGDAATATLVSADAPWRIGASDFGTAGEYAASLHLNSERKLRMRGKEVARVCMKEVPGSIRRALEKNAVALNDIDHVLVHQGSRFIVEAIGQAIGAPARTPFLAQSVGNTSSSSIPLGLRQLWAQQPDSEAIVLSSFGVGLSWGSTVIRRKDGPRQSRDQ